MYRSLATKYAFIKKIKGKKIHKTSLNTLLMKSSADLCLKWALIRWIFYNCLFDLGLTFFSHIATVSGCGRELNAHF